MNKDHRCGPCVRGVHADCQTTRRTSSTEACECPSCAEWRDYKRRNPGPPRRVTRSAGGIDKADAARSEPPPVGDATTSVGPEAGL